MNEEEARKILGETVQHDGSLRNGSDYVEWPHHDERSVCLDADFTADDLEAIAWWMRNMKVKKA